MLEFVPQPDQRNFLSENNPSTDIREIVSLKYAYCFIYHTKNIIYMFSFSYRFVFKGGKTFINGLLVIIQNSMIITATKYMNV